MPSPTPASSTASTRTSASTSHSITLPSAPTAGNLLVALLGIDQVNNATTSSTGWSRIGLITHNAGAASISSSLAVFVGIAGTAGALTVALSTSATSASVVLELSGHNGTGGVYMNTTGATSGTGSSATVSYPSLSPSAGTADYLAIALASNATPTYTHTAPSGYAVTPTAGVPRSGTGSSSANCAVFLRSTTSLASIAPGSGTLSSADRWVCTTLAVAPGSSGGSGTTRKRGSFQHLVGAA